MIRKAIFLAAAGLALCAQSTVLGIVALASLVVSLPVGFTRAAGDGAWQRCRRLLASLAAVLLAFIVLIAPAQAAAVTSVDLQPFLAQIINLAIMVTGPPAAALIVGVVFRLYRQAGIQISFAEEAKIRDAVDHGLSKAADYARVQIGTRGPIPYSVRSEALAHAMDYALEAIPDALNKLGIADKGSKRLANMIEARLGPSVG